MAMSKVEHIDIYIENLFKYLRSREEVFGKFFAILVTVLGSIGYTLVKAPQYTWLAVILSNMVLLAGINYISTLSYNYRYLQMCLSKIECLTGIAYYVPNTWNLIARDDGLSEKEFIPDIFNGFLNWMKSGSIIITIVGLVDLWFFHTPYFQGIVCNILHKYTPLPCSACYWIVSILIAMVTSFAMLLSCLLNFLLLGEFRRKVYQKFQRKFSRAKIEEELKISAQNVGFKLHTNLRRDLNE